MTTNPPTHTSQPLASVTIDAHPSKPSHLQMAQPKNAIRLAREARGWTQQELAHKAGVSNASVYRLERRPIPEGDAADKVFRALGLSASAVASTSSAQGLNLPSNMGQMIGRLQLPMGVDDFYLAALEVARERKASDAVLGDLARARDEAPPDAGIAWWMRRVVNALERTHRK
jgi:transcriptional regulator with XRE-family HTH domain